MKQLYLLCLGLFWIVSLFAQQEIPLRQNRILQAYELKRSEQLPAPVPLQKPRVKTFPCADPADSIIYVEALRGVRIPIDIDTVGLGKDGVYNCLNCDAAPGRAVVEEQELVFQASADVVAQPYVFVVSYCNNAGQCASANYTILAKRRGLHYFPPRTVLDAGEWVVNSTDPSRLPGELVCNYFPECPDDYEGRNQRIYFTTEEKPDYQFIYKASRYSGIDSVCVALCDEYTICDTFHFAFQIQLDTLRLPFMDDFSYAGPFTDAALWLDEDVYINNELADQPPSVGVATFDGVDFRGNTYGGGYGPADRLTSNNINLKSATGDLHLSYWVQRRGLGDRPERQDSLLLEFKDRDGQWQYIRAFEGAPGSQPNTAEEPFRFYRDKLEPQFIHTAFQFRFTNFSDRNGIIDTWHVDYVRLSDRNSQNDSIFSDIAFTKKPERILETYSSMPWNHFKGFQAQELDPSISVGLFNHDNQALSADSSSVIFREKNTGVQLLPKNTLLNGQEANIESRVPVNKEFFLNEFPLSAPGIWENLIESFQQPEFDDTAPLEFITQYNISEESQIRAGGLEAVRRNDQVEQITIFDNYFAYDDGTAESGFIAQEGQSAALKFTANEADSLRGISIHFPFTTIDASEQLFDLKVWVGELDGEPEYQAFLQNPVYTNVFFDTLQGFSTYPLVDVEGNPAPLAIPKGDFYIGWEQVSACSGTDCVAIGYDRNTPEVKSKIFQLSAKGWEPLDSLPFSVRGGALMIRAVVGSETPIATPVRETPPPIEARIFPNPAYDLLNIALPDARYDKFSYMLYNGVGQVVQKGRLQAQISLGDQPAGLYYIQILQPEVGQKKNYKFIKLQ